MFEEFQADVDRWKEIDPPFKEQGGNATLTVAPWQLDKQGQVALQKVTLVITVDGKQQAPLVRFISRDKDKPAQ